MAPVSLPFDSSNYSYGCLTYVQEQVQYQDPALESQYELRSSTNVYAVGKVILSLLCLLDGGEVRGARYDDATKGVITLPQHLYDDQIYSPALLVLVEVCLDPLPPRRMEVDELLRIITDHVQAYPDEHGSVPLKFNTLPEDAAI